MAEEKNIIVHFAVPQSVYGQMVALAEYKGLKLDQLCTIAVGAGLKAVMKLKGFK